MSRLRVSAVLVAVLAGCGGDGSNSDREGAPAPSARVQTNRTPEATPAPASVARVRLRSYRVPAGSHPHDVAPAPDGSVWYTAQGAGKLGRLDPRSGRVREVALGEASAPHG